MEYLLLIPFVCVWLCFLYGKYKIRNITGKIAYILEEYAGSTINGFVSEPYYNVSYEHYLYVKKILKRLNISNYYLNEFNHKRVKNKSLKFCEENNWINNKTKNLLDKELESFGFFKENKFKFHNEAQKQAFLNNKKFNEFTNYVM